MKKMDLIIKEDDPRYSLLSTIFEKYDWDNIVFHDNNWIRYYITPELVLKDFSCSYTNCVLSKPRENFLDDDNWVSRYVLEKRLNNCCFLTTQEYFDLVILHINDRSERPKCVLCGKDVPWGGRFTWGYNQSVWWYDVKFTYCCMPHAKKFQADNAERYFPKVSEEISRWIQSGWEAIPMIKAARSRFISGPNATRECVMYCTWKDSGFFKFGIAYDLEMRQSFAKYAEQNSYHSPKILFRSNGIEVANLEALVKLEFGGKENLLPEDVPKFFQVLRKCLKERPIKNPFDD